MTNKGKQFEEQFRKDFIKSFPDGFILRLPDQMTGYKSYSQNPCDFICYAEGILFMVECKSHKGASVPFDAISQYDKLKQYTNRKGVRTGIVAWLYEKDIVFYVPVSTIEQMKKDGKKSVGIKAIEEGYNIIKIPSEKKRVFMSSDYNILLNLQEGE